MSANNMDLGHTWNHKSQWSAAIPAQAPAPLPQSHQIHDEATSEPDDQNSPNQSKKLSSESEWENHIQRSCIPPINNSKSKAIPQFPPSDDTQMSEPNDCPPHRDDGRDGFDGVGLENIQNEEHLDQDLYNNPPPPECQEQQSAQSQHQFQSSNLIPLSPYLNLLIIQPANQHSGSSTSCSAISVQFLLLSPYSVQFLFSTNHHSPSASTAISATSGDLQSTTLKSLLHSLLWTNILSHPHHLASTLCAMLRMKKFHIVLGMKRYSKHSKNSIASKPTLLAFHPLLWRKLLDLAKAQMQLHIAVKNAFPQLEEVVDGICHEVLIEVVAHFEDKGWEVEAGYYPAHRSAFQQHPNIPQQCHKGCHKNPTFQL
ncbi:hypothetical protein J3A83DRAFT_4184744 [Scleroderma citrinum]